MVIIYTVSMSRERGSPESAGGSNVDFELPDTSAIVVNLDCKLLWNIESPWKQTSELGCGGLLRLGD